MSSFQNPAGWTPRPGRTMRRSESRAAASTAGTSASAQPTSAQPASAQPASAQPASAQPAPATPAPAQPASAQPASAQPAPAVHSPAGTGSRGGRGGAGGVTPSRGGLNTPTPLPGILSKTNNAWGSGGQQPLPIPPPLTANPGAPLSGLVRTTRQSKVQTNITTTTIQEASEEDDGSASPNGDEQPTVPAPRNPASRLAPNDVSDLTVNRETSVLHRAGNRQSLNTNTPPPPGPQVQDEAAPPPPEPSRFRIAWDIVRRRWYGWVEFCLIFITLYAAYMFLINNMGQIQEKALSVWHNVHIPLPTFGYSTAMPSPPWPQDESKRAATSWDSQPAGPTSDDAESAGPTSTDSADRWTKERLEKEWYAAIDKAKNPSFNIFGRLDKLEKDVVLIKNSLGLHNSTLEKLSNILPDSIVVRKDEKTGDFEIPDQFWRALSSKIANEHGIKHASSNDDWDSFWAQNQVKLHNYFETEFSARLESFRNSLHVVSQQMFTSMLEEKWNELAAEVHEKNTALEAAYRSLQSEIIANITRTTANAARIAREESYRTVQETVWSLPDKQLEMLARANDIQNAWRAANSINFFSPGLGAIIEPHYTTPTKKRPDNMAQALYKWLDGIPSANKPIKALEKWDEGTDCWCGAGMGTDGLGRIQLGVLMKHKLYPRKLTIEHISAAGTLDIGAAPKDLELWAEIVDPSLRADVKAAIALQGLNCDGGFDDNFVCLGKMKYDIHGLNNVQTFTLDVDLKPLGVKDGVQKAVVRVLNNYGRDYTCIYRARMHGDLARPEESLN